MRKNNTPIFSLVFLGALFALQQNTLAQISFSNANNLLHSETGVLGSNANIRSGNAVCVIDVDGNGLDDIVKMDNNRYVHIEYQQPGGSFIHQYIGDFGSNNCWGMAVADVDHNGYKDILYNGGSQAKLMKLNNTGTGMLGSVINLPNGNIFCQNGNFCDVNNDGWEDIFMCNDVGESRLWVNDGSGNFPAEQGNSPYINFDVSPGTGATQYISGHTFDESGNYGSVWTDFDNDGDVDLYIIHCRQSCGDGDLRRTNVLFVNNGNNTYTSDAATYNLASNDQDWTGSFGDIDNDGDFDLFMTKHNVVSRYYINDGNGNFTISPNTIAFGSMPQQSLFEDFDNDGFVDLMITGNAQQRLYRNNGDGTFTQVSNATLGFGSSNMLSFAAGDLNHDGKIDLYASYGSTYNNQSNTTDDVLWLNSTNNSNNFITFILTGTNSNKGALGAKALIYGSWGSQVREVRAGESYGTANTLHLHFGLGTANSIDSAIIKWPDGTQTTMYNLNANQFVCVIQGQTPLTNIQINASATQICPSQTVTLTAPSGTGYTYLWSNGATTQSIVVGAGTYSVTIDNGQSCAVTSQAVTIVENPAENPVITASGDLTICEGSTLTLQASGGSSYTWNTGSTNNSINVTTSGNYWVTVPGLCQTWNSDTLNVTVLNNPAPTGNDVTISSPSSVTLTVTGNNVSWYDAPTGGTLLGTGNNYITPVISSTTVFYAENETTYGGTQASVPAPNISTATLSANSISGHLVFDVLNECVLKTVEVATNTAGTRIIELRNSGGQVLQSATVNIPTGTSVVTLNFSLTPGTNYQLGTNTANNNTQFGFNSPALVRTQSGATFPYNDASNFVSITSGHNGTNLTPNTYYYFYNWVVQEPTTVCTSSRTPVTVYFSAVGIEETTVANSLNIYPNPASEVINIEFMLQQTAEVFMHISDITGRVVFTQNFGTLSGKVNRTMDINTLAKGAYNLTLTINNKTYTKTILIK